MILRCSLKLLFVVNVDWFFCSHRLPIALAALRHGYDVHIATTITNPKYRNLLASHGLTLHELNIDRSAKNLFGFVSTFFRLLHLFREVRPDILHLVTIQPVLLGGIASKFVRVKLVVYAISGLGHAFLVNSFFSLLRRYIVSLLYYFALFGDNRFVVFQNPNDQLRLSRLCSLSPHQYCLISGSGVDLSLFTYHPLPASQPIVMMASRLLVSKGVKDFVSAARILTDRGINAQFQLVGSPDYSNPLSVTVLEISNWEREGIVRILGQRSDLNELMSAAHIVCLPSYYPEGLPKVLCEAAASGRAIVTTDEPGCRDAIENGVTGLLVPSRDPNQLANALQYLLLNSSLIKEMGLAGRIRSERFFDINRIVEKHLSIYSSFLVK